MDESAQIHTASGAPVVNYSVVQGGWTGAGGIGNLASDPLFVDADGPDDIPGTEDDDLRLRVHSPAIDAGDNRAVPPDWADLDGDGDTSEPTPLDLAGRPRFWNNISVPDTGVGSNDYPDAIVDMGAYERLLPRPLRWPQAYDKDSRRGIGTDAPAVVPRGGPEGAQE